MDRHAPPFLASFQGASRTLIWLTAIHHAEWRLEYITCSAIGPSAQIDPLLSRASAEHWASCEAADYFIQGRRRQRWNLRISSFSHHSRPGDLFVEMLVS